MSFGVQVIQSNPQQWKPAVIYLARKHEGIESFKRFVSSYTQNPCGLDHDLVVLYKGFDSNAARFEAGKAFHGVPHRAIELDDEGYDIGAYRKALEAISNEYVCFLNTHTEIASENWLRLMYQSMLLSDIGIVGSTGSYESLRSSIGLQSEVTRLCKSHQFPYDEAVDYYFRFLTEKSCRKWRSQRSFRIFRWARRVQQYLKRIERSPRSKVVPIENSKQFPTFPNPHIRSNGFMVHRNWMYESVDVPIRNKHDAFLFESGPNSLTARIRRAGLRAVVVDRRGNVYDVPDWWKSRTFRIADQEDILLTDNQSRGFMRLDPGSRYTHTRITWGDYVGEALSNFPNFEFGFTQNDGVVF